MLQSRISGFKEANNLLKQLPRRVQNRVLQNATRETLKETAQQPIKAAAPRHSTERSPASRQYGTLKSNIRVAKLRKVRRGEKGARIHTGRAFWGYLIEKGTRHMPARPWFAPAFRALKSPMIRKLGEKIGRGIEKEANNSFRRGPRL